jgi:hypothetical protein
VNRRHGRNDAKNYYLFTKLQSRIRGARGKILRTLQYFLNRELACGAKNIEELFFFASINQNKKIN